MNKPTVGRIVHYVSYDTPNGEYKSECRAAVVTTLADWTAGNRGVGLAVLNPDGMFFNRSVPHDEGGETLGDPLSALTPVVEPEPTFMPGDVVRIDGENHMLRTNGIKRGWESPNACTDFIDVRNFSELWRDGRVDIVYRAETNA